MGYNDELGEEMVKEIEGKEVTEIRKELDKIKELRSIDSFPKRCLKGFKYSGLMLDTILFCSSMYFFYNAWTIYNLYLHNIGNGWIKLRLVLTTALPILCLVASIYFSIVDFRRLSNKNLDLREETLDSQLYLKDLAKGYSNEP